MPARHGRDPYDVAYQGNRTGPICPGCSFKAHPGTMGNATFWHAECFLASGGRGHLANPRKPRPEQQRSGMKGSPHTGFGHGPRNYR